jgi:hypothetical protein
LLLGSFLEVGAYKIRDVILVFFSWLGFFDCFHVANDVLQEVVLLGSNLFQNIWHHFLEPLGLRVSSDNHQILSH